MPDQVRHDGRIDFCLNNFFRARVIWMLTGKIYPPPRPSPALGGGKPSADDPYPWAYEPPLRRGEGNLRTRGVESGRRIFISGGDKIFLS